MKEQIISFETALLAKEKGFDLEVRSAYIEDKLYLDKNAKGDYNNVEWVRTWRRSPIDDTVSAPTQSLLQKWLRDEKDILIYVDPRSHHIFQYHIIIDGNEIIGSERLNNWEQTLEKGLQEALKLIENEKN